MGSIRCPETSVRNFSLSRVMPQKSADLKAFTFYNLSAAHTGFLKFSYVVCAHGCVVFEGHADIFKCVSPRGSVAESNGSGRLTKRNLHHGVLS